MKTVNVATLKCSLSAYLKTVKAGEEITVVSHNHPVAKLIPFSPVASLSVREPAEYAVSLKNIRGIKPKKAIDPLAILKKLREDR